MPEDRRMAISSSSPLSPDEVARRTFATVRRGFAPDEVRAYLDAIAQGLRTQAERDHELRRALEDAEHRAANPVLDEETLDAALGQETSRVLRSAHEASHEMVAKATAEAERLLAEAREEIAATEAKVSSQLSDRVAQTEATTAELRRRAEEESASALEIARTEAEGLIAQARVECRDMVEEAQGLRARVLADLSKRRKVLHAQIEQLRAGREHLAETVRDVRHTIDTIADELFRVEDEARLAADAAGRQAVSRPDDESPEELAATLLAEESLLTGAGSVTVAVEETGELPVVATEEPEEPEPVTGEVEGEIVEIVEVVEIVEIDTDQDDTGGGESAPKPTVDALFAKLRASTEAAGATSDDQPAAEELSAGPDAGPPEERTRLEARRDELMAPVVAALARRMKRTFQDDQNDILDRLRSNHFTWSVGILPEEPEHHDAYSTAALPYLEEAAEAGASFVGSEGTKGPSVDELLGIAHQLAETVVGPLRRRLSDDERLHRAEEADVAEHVGSAFREWKGERVERLAGDYVLDAFSAGSIAGAAKNPDLLLEWVAVAADDAEPCPDCEDNALNGPQRPGGEFPTGHVRPPAHPGCRCLLAPPAP
jgi:DivIVA domain-containing protein